MIRRIFAFLRSLYAPCPDCQADPHGECEECWLGRQW